MKMRLFAVILSIFTIFLVAPLGGVNAQSSNTLNIQIISPNHGALFFQSPVLIDGILENAASGIAVVTCNGDPAIVEGDAFSCEVPLAHGTNTIVVSAHDNEGNSSSSSIEVTLEDLDELIQTYGPIVYFWSDEFGWGSSEPELYFPDDAELVLDSSSLVWALVDDEGDYYTNIDVLGSIPTSSQSLISDVENYVKTDPNYSDPKFQYYLDTTNANIYGNLDRAKSYVRVRSWGTSYTDVEFWIYYPFNGPARLAIDVPGYTFYNDLSEPGRHYSDWETIVLRFSNDQVQLEWVGLAQHGGMHWYTTSDLIFSDSHPYVYAAKFSHAIYPKSDRWYYKNIFNWGISGVSGDLYDLTSPGEEWEIFQEDNYKVISSAAPGHDIDEPSWITFNGRWGKYIQNYLSVDLVVDDYTWKELGCGPYGPTHDKHSVWWTPSVTITPDPAYSDNDLKANIWGWNNDRYCIPFIEPPICYESTSYQWQKWDGASWQDIPNATKDTLDSSNFEKNDMVKVVCKPLRLEKFPEWGDFTNTFSGMVEDTVIISNNIPVADANGPYSGDEGSPISLDASGSYDPDGEIVLYEWDMDNDGEYDDALGEMVSAIFGDNGTFTVKLKVTDEDGASTEDETTVSVANVAPILDAVSDQNKQSSDLVSIKATFTDLGYLDTHTASVDWGDGETGSLLVTETNGSGIATGTHTYYLLASYAVTVTITDDDGASTTDTMIVTVTRKTVSVDIKPGSDSNPINLESSGIVPVAILTDNDFDASMVDCGTVRFGPAEAAPVYCATEDVDGDGDTDIILHFRTQEVGLDEQDTEAILTGQTTDGIHFIGKDAVMIVPPNDKPKPPGKDSAPGQNKEPGEPAECKGKDFTPGQNK